MLGGSKRTVVKDYFRPNIEPKMWYKTLIKSVLAQKEGFLLLAVVCKSMCTMSRIIKESTESYISVLRFQRDVPYKFI